MPQKDAEKRREDVKKVSHRYRTRQRSMLEQIAKTQQEILEEFRLIEQTQVNIDRLVRTLANANIIQAANLKTLVENITKITEALNESNRILKHIIDEASKDES